MAELCDVQIHVNGQQTFFLNQKIISKFSGKLRKIIKQEKRTKIKNSGIEIDDFPGGPDGFELASRFCYNNGTTAITVPNVSLLHCCAVFLGMTEKVSACNLLHQTETFLEGIFYWSWNDILTCLKSCESFFSIADSSGLVQKLMTSLLAKIAQNSDIFISSSSSSSSPETASPFRLSSSTKSTTPEVLGTKPSKTNWWFEDLTILPPMIIERFVKTLGAYGADNNSLVFTRFLLSYLKTAAQSKHGHIMNRIYSKNEYAGIADTAVYGVILMGKSSFSCRGLFWVLRLVSGFGLSRDCRTGLEREIGAVLDQATLDDLLVSGNDHGSVYDVNLVVRLIRLFVHSYDKVEFVQKMKKVGRLIDKYLREVAPDQSLKISKFLGVAESLADWGRDCFDGVYRAVDIYLESHPSLSLEERSRICRCLNYKKLSLEACKEFAKNPRIPPRVAVEALAAQSSNIIAPTKDHQYSFANDQNSPSTSSTNPMVLYSSTGVNDNTITEERIISEENDEMRLNLQRMQWRVVELERVCRKMKGQMSRMGKTRAAMNISPAHTKALPRLC